MCTRLHIDIYIYTLWKFAWNTSSCNIKSMYQYIYIYICRERERVCVCVCSVLDDEQPARCWSQAASPRSPVTSCHTWNWDIAVITLQGFRGVKTQEDDLQMRFSWLFHVLFVSLRERYMYIYIYIYICRYKIKVLEMGLPSSELRVSRTSCACNQSW